jgi:hypothetical protein
MRKFVLAAAICVLVTACGATGIGLGSNPTPSPTPSSSARFDVVASETDHAVAMHVGQTLEVVLHAPNNMNNWTHPASSDESVLGPLVDPAATAARGVTLAAYQARKVGQVDLNSTASPRCSAGQPCPMYLAVYSLKVTITQ